MKKIGIRELKIHLSQYLKEVKKGEDVLITERGKIIAQIIPVKIRDSEKDMRSLLIQMAKNGHILLPNQWDKPSGRPKRKKVDGTPFSDAIIEDRR